jgi:hypothetical protein
MRKMKLNASQKNAALFAGLAFLALYLNNKRSGTDDSPISKPWVANHQHKLGGPF